MIQGLSAALSGLRAYTQRGQSNANNIANVNTQGFKASHAVSQAQEGKSGVRVTATRTSMTQGALITTGNPLHAAISGAGFFKVTTARGATGFTRSGQFQTDSQNRIVDQNGSLLQPTTTLPAGASNVAIEKNGTITADVNGSRSVVGKAEIATFNNPGGLERGGGNIYYETAASGQPVSGTAGAGGAGAIVPGALEESNVDLATEMVDMIQNKYGFAASAKMVKVQDEMLGSILDIKS